MSLHEIAGATDSQWEKKKQGHELEVIRYPT